MKDIAPFVIPAIILVYSTDLFNLSCIIQFSIVWFIRLDPHGPIIVPLDQVSDLIINLDFSFHSLAGCGKVLEFLPANLNEGWYWAFFKVISLPLRLVLRVPPWYAAVLVPLHAVMVEPGLRSVRLNSSLVVWTWAPVLNSHVPGFSLIFVPWNRGFWNYGTSGSCCLRGRIRRPFHMLQSAFTPVPSAPFSRAFVLHSVSVRPIPRHFFSFWQYAHFLEVFIDRANRSFSMWSTIGFSRDPLGSISVYWGVSIW